MASMFFAPSPLNVQSLVKLRTNSNYPRSSCYDPSPSKAKNSYLHLPYQNISHIESSKSSFTKGDGNFSFSFPKFPRVASTLSPSLSIIKACSGAENIYHFKAYDMRTREYIQLGDRYRRMVLLIVNIPQQGSEWTNPEIKFLNDLRRLYQTKSSVYTNGFEVLGFLHSADELKEKSKYESIKNEEKEINEFLRAANFPIFGKVAVNDDHEFHFTGIFKHHTMQMKKDEDLWYFLRHKSMDGQKIEKIKEGFEKILVDGEGVPIHHYPRFDGETLQSQPVQPGGDPGHAPGSDPRNTIQIDINKYY